MPSSGTQQTVLVVEDEADIASVVLDYLRFNGYAAEHLSDGLAAIAHIRRQPPDLLLLDVMLPGCDGFEVLQAIRRFTALPTIMLTARVEEVDRLLGLDCGADDYICKPFSPARWSRACAPCCGALPARPPLPQCLPCYWTIAGGGPACTGSPCS